MKCLNEEESITPLYNEIKKTVDTISCDYEILFVDDGSTDDSLKMIKALVKKDIDGTLFWAYGGDYGENMPTNYNFVCNGIISADYTPHPAIWEIKYAYQYIRFEESDNGYKISNFFSINYFFF